MVHVLQGMLPDPRGNSDPCFLSRVFRQPYLTAPDPRGDAERYLSGQVFGRRGAGVTPWDYSIFGNQDFNEVLLIYSNKSIPAGNTVGNTTTATDFSSQYTLPANALIYGDVLRFTATGNYSTPGIAGASDKLQIKLYWGAGATNAMQVTFHPVASTGLSGFAWRMEGTVLILTPGSGADRTTCPIAVNSSWQLDDGSQKYKEWQSTQASLTLDLSTSKLFKIQAKWFDVDVSYTITLEQFLIEHMRTP